MRKNNKIFIILLFSILLIVFCSNSVIAIRAKTEYSNEVSYGIAIFLRVWQYLQYMIPAAGIIIALIINEKKLNAKKVIKYILIGMIVCAGLFYIGTVIADNAPYQGYSSTTADMFEFNGRTIYFHK